MHLLLRHACFLLGPPDVHLRRRLCAVPRYGGGGDLLCLCCRHLHGDDRPLCVLRRHLRRRQLRPARIHVVRYCDLYTMRGRNFLVHRRRRKLFAMRPQLLLC